MPIHLMLASNANKFLARSQACRAKKQNMFATRGFVMTSATYSAVGKYLRMACFIDMTSWTKQNLRSMCLAQREPPELQLMAAVLSSKVTVGSVSWKLRSKQYTTKPYHVLGTTRSSPCIMPLQWTKRRSPASCSSSGQDQSRQSVARQMSI
jgi:hypothetical protein